MAQGKLGLPRFWAIGLLGPWIASFTALIFAAVTGVPGFNAGILNLGAGLLVLGFLFGLLPASISAVIFALVFPYLPTKRRRIIAAIIIGFCCAFLGLQLELRWLDFSPSPNVYFVFSVGIGGAVALVLTGVPLGQKALEP